MKLTVRYQNKNVKVKPVYWLFFWSVKFIIFVLAVLFVLDFTHVIDFKAFVYSIFRSGCPFFHQTDFFSHSGFSGVGNRLSGTSFFLFLRPASGADCQATGQE